MTNVKILIGLIKVTNTYHSETALHNRNDIREISIHTLKLSIEDTCSSILDKQNVNPILNKLKDVAKTLSNETKIDHQKNRLLFFTTSRLASQLDNAIEPSLKFQYKK